MDPYQKIFSKQRGKQKEGTWKHKQGYQTSKNTYGKKAKKKANLFKNCFRSGGEENKRQMANNVMQEMRVL